jgi:hypothetical protein
VAKVAGVVNTVSGAAAPVLYAATAATVAVPVVGEVVAGAAAANTAVGVGSGVVKAGAELVHDNTNKGETLSQAMGRVRNYAVKAGNVCVPLMNPPPPHFALSCVMRLAHCLLPVYLHCPTALHCRWLRTRVLWAKTQWPSSKRKWLSARRTRPFAPNSA